MPDSGQNASERRLQLDNVFVAKWTQCDMARKREMKNLELCRVVHKRMTEVQQIVNNLTATLSCSPKSEDELEESLYHEKQTLAQGLSRHGRYVEYIAKVETRLHDLSMQMQQLNNMYRLLVEERDTIVQDIVCSRAALRQSTFLARDADGRTHGA